jgi:ribosomal protein S27AE
MPHRLQRSTQQRIADIFRRLDYAALGPVYCDEGGEEFWKAKRVLCWRCGSVIAAALRRRLPVGGRSLYVGAGVPEIPPLMMELLELKRKTAAYNLRGEEVRLLNRACRDSGLRFELGDAGHARGGYDHLWMVSVLNDPERFPDLSALSYGRATPLTFHPQRFEKERRVVRRLVARCLAKLHRPGWVTTTTEEVQWIAEWCHRRGIPYAVGAKQYPTATVGDPVCFVRLE